MLSRRLPAHPQMLQCIDEWGLGGLGGKLRQEASHTKLAITTTSLDPLTFPPCQGHFYFLSPPPKLKIKK